MKIENSRTLTSDNIELETVKYIPENPKGIIYICHGLSVPKEAPGDVLKDTAIALGNAGFKVVTFDFRGHATSGGKDIDFTIENGMKDLDAVFKTETNDLPIGMLGFSCGGTVSILYSYLNKIKLNALVLYSPALEFLKTTMTNPNSIIGSGLMNAQADGSYEANGYITVPNGFRIGKNFFDKIAEINVCEYVPKLSTKVLICQALQDQMLDFEYTKSLGEPISDKYVVFDSVHALVEEKEKAITETVEWFKRYL